MEHFSPLIERGSRDGRLAMHAAATPDKGVARPSGAPLRALDPLVTDVVTPEAQRTPTRVLVVDGDPVHRAELGALLVRARFEVSCVGTVAEALRAMRSGEPFSTVVTGRVEPGPSGIGLLASVRAIDPELPVVVLTASPCIESAAETVRQGGFRYLVRPVDPTVVVDTVRSAAAHRQVSELKRLALEFCSTAELDLAERIRLERPFQDALAGTYVAFQPIIDGFERRAFGFEALVRSKHPELSNPGALFGAATKLGRLHDLGRTIRRHVGERAREFPSSALVFVNVHPADLADPALYDPREPLSRMAPRVVLEITERTSLDDVDDLRGRIQRLRALGFRIAVDDLGAGYAGLASIGQLEPDVVKLDMALIRGIDGDARKARLVGALISACRRDLSIEVVAEGIETEGEERALLALGARMLQGYRFGRPRPEIVDPFL